MKINELVKLLKSNYNLVLTGAPGAGKTFLAKAIAKKMKAEIGFVQFHPSYDYTDFVEGLRPKKDTDGVTIVFERKDGVFKEFCKRALEKVDTIDNFNKAWHKLIDKLNRVAKISITTLSKKSTFEIELDEIGDGLKEVGTTKYFSKQQMYNVYQGLPGSKEREYDNHCKAIIKYLITDEEILLHKYNKGKMTESSKPFVFIIDEINRGEISKIFGELFFSIDSGYRGEDGRVRTQYQNLVEESDEFYDGFYVPKNVYIIGTMNDIDRSIESMDFAIRRRFAWVEIKAQENLDMIDKMINALYLNVQKEEAEKAKAEIKSRMRCLNSAIGEIDELGEAYHIGGAYFLKIKNYLNIKKENLEDAFKKLWKYHLEGLLKEYLRGIPDAEEILEKFKKAYNKHETIINETEDDSAEADNQERPEIEIME